MPTVPVLKGLGSKQQRQPSQAKRGRLRETQREQPKGQQKKHPRAAMAEGAYFGFQRDGPMAGVRYRVTCVTRIIEMTRGTTRPEWLAPRYGFCPVQKRPGSIDRGQRILGIAEPHPNRTPVHDH